MRWIGVTAANGDLFVVGIKLTAQFEQHGVLIRACGRSRFATARRDRCDHASMQDLFDVWEQGRARDRWIARIGLMIAQGFVEAGAKVYVSSRKASRCATRSRPSSRTKGTCLSLPE